MPSIAARTISFSVGLVIAWVACSCPPPLQAAEEDPVFSGPQIGERLAPFEVVLALGENAGTTVDPVAAAAGKPTLLVFVHELTRPGMALTRALTEYAKSQSDRGAVAGIVWLDDDKAKAEAYLRRAQKSLNFSVPVGVSVDGGEGPGAYGLNRNVELTILVANDNIVTANFALVQPSVTEAAKIAAELAKLVGQAAPTADAIEKLAYPGNRMRRQANMRRNAGQPAGRGVPSKTQSELRAMMTKIIALDAGPAAVRTGVEEINEWVEGNQARQAALGRMSAAILDRGLGGETLQSVLKKWRREYAPTEQPTDKASPTDDTRPRSDKNDDSSTP